jgi:predicted lipoprotein with Yx(FWY)xxD motif
MRSTSLTLAALAAGVLALSACGSGAQTPHAPSAQSRQDSMAGMDHHSMGGMHHGSDGVELWAVQSGPLGTIVTNADGHVLHRYDGDSASPSTTTCTDACAAQWPPVLLEDGKQPQLLGVDASRVGVIQRPDGGRQVTLAGWPLYMWAQDDGDLASTEGQGTDGKWFAVAPDGSKAVTP